MNLRDVGSETSVNDTVQTKHLLVGESFSHHINITFVSTMVNKFDGRRNTTTIVLCKICLQTVS